MTETKKPVRSRVQRAADRNAAIATKNLMKAQAKAAFDTNKAKADAVIKTTPAGLGTWGAMRTEAWVRRVADLKKFAAKKPPIMPAASKRRAQTIAVLIESVHSVATESESTLADSLYGGEGQ